MIKTLQTLTAFSLLCCVTASVAAQSPVPLSEDTPSESTPPAIESAQPVDQLTALESIQGQIEEVRENFAARKTGAETQKQQQEIIKTLEKLLQQQNSQAPQPKESQQKTTSQPKPKEKPEDSDLEGNKSKRESETSSGTDRPDQENDRLSKDLQEKIWGHLPERVRNRMRSVDGERFLPKYERLIRAYYERMASELSKE